MINLNKDVLIITRDNHGLNDAIRDAVTDVMQFHEKLHGQYTNSPAQKKSSQFGFLRTFSTQIIENIRVKNPFECIKLLMQASLLTGQQRSPDLIVDAFGGNQLISVPPTQYSGLFRGVSSILLYLWKYGHIVLNPYFSPNLKAHELRRYESSTLRSLNQKVATSNFLDSEKWNVHHHSKRLFWATDWITWDRFRLSELAEIHSRWLEAKRLDGNDRSSYPVPPIPFRILLTMLSTGLIRKVTITENDLEDYQRTLDLASNQLVRKTGLADVALPSLYVQPSKARDEGAVFAHLIHAREPVKTEARWPGAVLTRPGWEDLPIRECGSSWARLFDGYLEDWRQQYESDSKYKSLGAFSDYLFLYLNWWFYKHEHGEDSFPSRPGQIKRFAYIKKGVKSGDEARPLTFLEFLEKRFPTSGTARASACRAAMDFFDWVVEEYSGTEMQSDLFDKDFKNPVRDKDIHYRTTETRKHARVRIGKRHAELLCEYLLAVEGFFSKLEVDFNEGRAHDLPFHPIPTTLPAEEYGYVPVVFYRGKVMPVMHVPAAYHRHTVDFVRSFNLNSNWPNLSALRLLCFMMETGLRGAHIRWLSRHSLLRSDEYQNFLCKRIDINTDKAGSEFSIPVSDEAYSLLHRQLAIVTRILDGFEPDPVHYMGRAHSRFEPIDVLFYRPSATSKVFTVINDSAYREQFRILLAVFGAWLQDEMGENVEFVTTMEGQTLRELLAGPRSLVSENTQSIYTPHSLRSTVISERISVLPIRLAGLLAGHRNEESTAYYHQVDEEELYRILNQPKSQSVVSFSFRRDDPAYIHTASTDSALRQAIRKNRHEAEELHGFTTVTLGYAGPERSDEDGLSVLRTADESEIAYFDTHLCPFGGICPKDVIEELKAPFRCGLCRYAVKAVDQLPAIRAKIRELEASGHKWSTRAQELFRSSSQAEAQPLFDKSDMDAMEALGWHLAELVLEDKLAQLRSGAINVNEYHVDAPEMLNRRLVRAVLPDSKIARVLQRISETNAYPSMQDEEVRDMASRLKRIMLGAEEPMFGWEKNPIAELCSYLTARMDAEGITTSDLFTQLNQHRESINIRQLNAGNSFGKMISRQEV